MTFPSAVVYDAALSALVTDWFRFSFLLVEGAGFLMVAPMPEHVPAIAFCDVVLDPSGARLLLDGIRVELPPKAFAVLCYLAGHPGKLVSKEELLNAVWGHCFVSDSVLKKSINAIRKALYDDCRQPHIIET